MQQGRITTISRQGWLSWSGPSSAPRIHVQSCCILKNKSHLNYLVLRSNLQYKHQYFSRYLCISRLIKYKLTNLLLKILLIKIHKPYIKQLIYTEILAWMAMLTQLDVLIFSMYIDYHCIAGAIHTCFYSPTNLNLRILISLILFINQSEVS